MSTLIEEVGETKMGVDPIDKEKQRETTFGGHDPYSYEHIEKIAKYLLEETKIRPKVGIICGTGLGGLAELIEDKDSFPYEKIPDFPRSTGESQ